MKFLRSLKKFLIDMFSQNETIGLTSLDAVKSEVKTFIVEKQTDTVIYDIFK